MIEHWLFFDLCKRYRRADVEQVYIAIQSALAFGAREVDVGPLLSRIRPPGYRGLDDGYTPAIGTTGLAFFHWLFDIELVKEGSTDYHTYRFTRKHDRKKIAVTLKIVLEPKSEFERPDYRDQFKKLERSRESLFVTKRYGTTTEFLFGS